MGYKIKLYIIPIGCILKGLWLPKISTIKTWEVSFLGIKRKSHWDVTYMMRYKIYYIKKNVPFKKFGL